MSGQSAARRAEPCSVCDDDLSTTRLCRACRADPANVDWCEGRAELHIDADRMPAAGHRLSDLVDRPLREPSELHVRCLELMTRTIVDARAVRVRGPAGRRVWVLREERRPLRFREVAWLLDCSESYVRKTYRSVVE